GHDERPLELLAGGAVGEGAAGCERRWSVFLDDGEPLLALCADDRPTCVLRCYPDGVWRGHWLEFERMPIELAPLTPGGRLDEADSPPPGTTETPSALVHGHRMFLHDANVDRWISPALAAHGTFEPLETEWFLQEIRPGDVVVDVGANIGYY